MLSVLRRGRAVASEAGGLMVLPAPTRWPATTAFAARHVAQRCVHPALCLHPRLVPLFAAVVRLDQDCIHKHL